MLEAFENPLKHFEIRNPNAQIAQKRELDYAIGTFKMPNCDLSL